MEKTSERFLNTALVFILCGVLLGGFYIQFVLHETPCPLCLLQRLGMIGVATGALLNLNYGVRPQHYALSLLSAMIGGSISLRHITLHICPTFAQTQLPVLGLHLYTWALIVFVCSILVIILGLALYNIREHQAVYRPLQGSSRIALILLVVIALTNAAATLWQCGLGTCE